MKQVFRVKKLVGRRGAPELELLAVVIVLYSNRQQRREHLQRNTWFPSADGSFPAI